MKVILLFIITLNFQSLVFGQINSGEILDFTDIEGKWFINKSNFPMWLKGNKSCPTFNYTIENRKNGAVLIDSVSFLKNGKEKAIIGIDKTIDKTNLEFVWRGKGLLFIAKSKWKILHIDTNNEWAIIYFEKTLFTANGYDVISRQKNITSDLEEEINIKLVELGITLKLTTISQF